MSVGRISEESTLPGTVKYCSGARVVAVVRGTASDDKHSHSSLSIRPVAGLRSLKTFFPRCLTISYGQRYRA